MGKDEAMTALVRELLPCPFCNGDAEIIDRLDHQEMKRWYKPACKVCDATMGAEWRNAKGAIRAWNSRAALQAPGAGQEAAAQGEQATDSPQEVAVKGPVAAAPDAGLVEELKDTELVKAKAALRYMNGMCRPAVKSYLDRAERQLLRCNQGNYPEHYKPLLEQEVTRYRVLLDDIDAALDAASKEMK